MQVTSTLLAVGAIASSIVAHPGLHAALTGSDLSKRALLSRRCASAVGNLNKKRYEKRNALRKRDLESRSHVTYQITAEAPFYEVIQNTTCVLTPEVTQGPYVWPRSQTLRQDMTEDQPGVPFWLDVGVIDINTCEPLENALVDFWHCNATGSYSSFTELPANTPFEDLLDQMNLTTNFTIGKTDIHTDDTTFLRGMWPTDSAGVMEMKTIVPGFYVKRAIHIHAQVHIDWSVARNGTISSSNRVSTGQLYLNETISQQLMALEPYVSHTQINRTTNDMDSEYGQSVDGTGYNPVIDIIAADGVNIANGVIGYITIGVDTTDVQTASLSDAPAPYQRAPDLFQHPIDTGF